MLYLLGAWMRARMCVCVCVCVCGKREGERERKITFFIYEVFTCNYMMMMTMMIAFI